MQYFGQMIYGDTRDIGADIEILKGQLEMQVITLMIQLNQQPIIQ